MKINIKATNIDLTTSLDDYINKKLSALLKFIKEDEASIYVEIGKTTNHHKQGDIFRAEFNVEVPSDKFYTFSEKEDLYSAIDDAKDEISRQIISKKNKKQTLFKRGSSRVKRILKGISDHNPFS